MNKQDAFKQSILDNNISRFEILLNDDEVNPSFDNDWAIQNASRNGFTVMVRLLLNYKSVNPSQNENWAILSASGNGHIDIVKLLLNDPRVDPSKNKSIYMADMNKHIDIVDILIKDKRVADVLKKENSFYSKKFLTKHILKKLKDF